MNISICDLLTKSVTEAMAFAVIHSNQKGSQKSRKMGKVDQWKLEWFAFCSVLFERSISVGSIQDVEHPKMME